MEYSLDTIISFMEYCELAGIPFNIKILRECNDDGYSCPSYFNTISFSYFLPVIEWQHFDTFNPKEVFDSVHFDYIWDHLEEIDEDSVFNIGKHIVFDKLIKQREIQKTKERKEEIKRDLINRLGKLTDEEGEVIDEVVNEYINVKGE